MEEGGGIEPLWLITIPEFSGLVADRSAAPSMTEKIVVAGRGVEPRSAAYETAELPSFSPAIAVVMMRRPLCRMKLQRRRDRNMVDIRGFEPRPSPCRGDVLPLQPDAHVFA